MGIINNKSGELQPVCDDCGIALCWTISEFDYLLRKDFWDNWKCKVCKKGETE